MRRAVLSLFVLAACAGPRAAEIHYRGADEAVQRDVADGRARVERFFGAPFARDFAVEVFADRAAFTAHLRKVFDDPAFDGACWMVGVGTGDGLAVLDPRRWKTEACDHDPGDTRAVAALIAHELVHVYHSQMNQLLDREPARFEPMAWFVEGLATYASGQLEDGHLAPASEAVQQGVAPAALADAWTGKYRYGVSGSLVAYADQRYGREAVKRMLRSSSPAELLAVLGLGEAELLAAWRASLGTR